MDDWPATLFVHRTPLNKQLSADAEPAGDTLTQALQEVLDRLGRRCDLRSAQLFAREQVDGISGSVFLFPVSPRHVLVIGVSSVAAATRRLLDTAGGFAGWRQHTLPATHTPVNLLHEHLVPQMYNILPRNHFSTVEEVAAMPDQAWQDLRNAGPKFVAAVHSAIDAIATITTPGTAAVNVTRPAADVQGAARRDSVHQRLTPAAWLRYDRFAGLLGDSQLPAAALDAICEALNTEALPAADPTVLRLLQTGRELDLLQHYLATHGSPVNAGPAPMATETAPEWTVELAEEILRQALPTGSTLVRALINEGGTATVQRLKELTGATALHPWRQTLTTATVKVFREHNLDRHHRHVVQAHHDPDNPRSATVHHYQLPAELMPAFDAALRNLGR